MSPEQKAFEQLIKDAGIPTTESEIKNAWQQEAEGTNVPINNDSDYSPFWRIVSALITKAAHWLIQSLITHVLPNVFIKTATGVFLELLAWGLGIERKAEVNAKGQVVFTRSNNSGELVIPAQTEIQSANINGQIYSLFTDNETRFIDGQSELMVNVTAAEAGQSYNLSAGYYAILPTAMSGIYSVTNRSDWLTTPGADQEKDDALRLRCRNQFSALNQYHTDAVYLSMMTQFPGVSISNVYFERNAPRGPGTANAYIMLDLGNPDASFLAPIESYIMDQGNHGHGDDLRLFAMPESNIDIECQIWLNEFLAANKRDELQQQVSQFIRAAFRGNDDYSPTLVYPHSRFSFSKLAAEIHAHFSDVLSIEFTNSDIVSALTIPRAQNIVVNAQ